MLIHSQLIEKLQHCNPTLTTYLVEKIIPTYQHFDKAHQEDHVLKVIDGSLELATQYNANLDMALVIAAFHDTGLAHGREFHHLYSGDILKSDTTIAPWFSSEQLEIMIEAIEDHRASNTHEPRTIYGKIVAEADRIIDTDITLRRTVLYGLKHLDSLDIEIHYQRFRTHLIEKYGRKGYLKLWLRLPSNEIQLEKIRMLIESENLLRDTFEQIFKQETSKK